MKRFFGGRKGGKENVVQAHAVLDAAAVNRSKSGPSPSFLDYVSGQPQSTYGVGAPPSSSGGSPQRAGRGALPRDEHGFSDMGQPYESSVGGLQSYSNAPQQQQQRGGGQYQQQEQRSQGQAEQRRGGGGGGGGPSYRDEAPSYGRQDHRSHSAGAPQQQQQMQLPQMALPGQQASPSGHGQRHGASSSSQQYGGNSGNHSGNPHSAPSTRQQRVEAIERGERIHAPRMQHETSLNAAHSPYDAPTQQAQRAGR